MSPRLLGKVRRLEKTTRRRRPDECDGRPGLLLSSDAPVPPDAPVCPRCGAVHALLVEEVVVETPPARNGAGSCPPGQPTRPSAAPGRK